MSTILTRTLKHGIQLAARKGFMTFTSTLVLTIAASVIMGSLLLQSLFASAITAVEKRVDINVFMLPGTPDATTTGLADALDTLPEVTSVTVTTAAEALVDFKTKHKDDFLTLQALEELDNNPLGSIVSVQADNPASYEVVARYLSSDNAALSPEFSGSIEKINYFENKTIIERLSRLQSNIQIAMMGVIIVGILLAALMVGAIVRSVVYAIREELVLLRALGSTSVFMYGQFLVAYALYALLATAASIAIGYAASLWIDMRLVGFAPGVSVVSFISGNILQVTGLVLTVTLLIGWVSSLIAVYLSLGSNKRMLN